MLLPPARAGASLEAVGSKLYLFGGLNQEDGWLQELYVFDSGLINLLVTSVFDLHDSICDIA